MTTTASATREEQLDKVVRLTGEPRRYLEYMTGDQVASLLFDLTHCAQCGAELPELVACTMCA